MSRLTDKIIFACLAVFTLHKKRNLPFKGWFFYCSKLHYIISENYGHKNPKWQYLLDLLVIWCVIRVLRNSKRLQKSKTRKKNVVVVKREKTNFAYCSLPSSSTGGGAIKTTTMLGDISYNKKYR